MHINLKNLSAREYFAGYTGKMIHTENMTIAFWEVEAGAEVPLHSHHHEQVMHVIEGRFEFTLNDVSREYGPGELVVVPPNHPHSGKAITHCKLLDLFSPVREEYK